MENISNGEYYKGKKVLNSRAMTEEEINESKIASTKTVAKQLWNVASLNGVLVLHFSLSAIIGIFVIDEPIVPCIILSVVAVLFLSFTVLLRGISKLVEK